LLPRAQFLFIARMYSKVSLALGTALAAIALCCFVDSSLGQDALTIPVAENDDVDADDKDEKSRRRRSHKSESSVNAKNAPWANANENRSLAVTSVTQMAEAESTVVAQTPTPSPAIDASGNVLADTILGASEAVNYSEVVVTGSNIAGSQSPDWVPESIYTREAIEINGSRSLGDFMKSIPQNSGPTFTENQSDSLAPGAAAVALHGLSPDATLVLINGRRVAPYPFAQTGITAFVDLNSIPLAGIQQIDVLRDGASAIYGSDAIAGVVNVRFLPKYHGALVNFGYGNTTDTDTGEYYTSLVSGYTDEKRGVDLMVVADYFDRNALFQVDRFFSESIDQTRQGGSSFLSSASNPGTVFDPVTGDPLKVPANSNGIVTVSELENNPGVNRFDRAPFQPLVPETERYGVYGRVKVRLTPAIDVFAEGGYRHIFTKQQLAPSPIEGDVEGISVPGINPFNPFETPVFFRYRVTEAGPRVDHISTDVYRAVAGLNFHLSKRWEMESAFLYSETNAEDKTFNNLSRAAVIAGLADPNPATSFNIFGAGNHINNPATIEGLKVTTTREGNSRIVGGDTKLNGPLYSLPAGDLFSAFGLEYRYEELEDKFDPFATAGGVIDLNSTSAGGNRDVISGFGEVLIPIVSPAMEIPLFNNLEVQAAFRAENYSDFGSIVNPKVGVAWRPIADWFLLRGSYGTGFRAPSLVQLFTGSLTFSQELRDPRRFVVTGSPEDESSPLQVLTGGNPDLEPEDSENYSAGFVFTPPIVPGLLLSLDFFRVDVEHSIANLDPQFILDNEADFPGFVVRAPPTASDMELGIPGRVLLVNSSFQNLGFVTVQGIDIGAEYVTPSTPIGIFTARFEGAYLDSFKQQGSEGQEVLELAGTFLRPKFRSRTQAGWRIGGFETVFTFNYTDSYLDSPPDRTVDYNTTFDLFLQYRFGLGSGRTAITTGLAKERHGKATIDDKGGKETFVPPGSVVRQNRWLDGLALRFGVRNIFDDPPPFANNTAGFPVGLEDPRQRFVFFDIEKKFW
jgi:iron complex outermembrane recepter protein